MEKLWNMVEALESGAGKKWNSIGTIILALWKLKGLKNGIVVLQSRRENTPNLKSNNWKRYHATRINLPNTKYRSKGHIDDANTMKNCKNYLQLKRFTDPKILMISEDEDKLLVLQRWRNINASVFSKRMLISFSLVIL